MTILSSQLRAGRALLNVTQQECAEGSGVSIGTIKNIEKDDDIVAQGRTAAKLERYFTLKGIEFLSTGGVQPYEKKVLTLKGRKGFAQFFDLVFKEMQQSNDKVVRVDNVDERQFIGWQDTATTEEHTQRMINMGCKFHILIKQGDTYTPAMDYGDYRWTPREEFSTSSSYIFGNKFTKIVFHGDDVIFYVIEEPLIAQAEKIDFDHKWDRSDPVDRGTKDA